MTSLLASLLLVLASPQSNRAIYHGVVSLDPATKAITARWKIRIAASPAMRDTVRFLLNPGLRVSRLSGPSVRGYRDTTEDGSRTIVVAVRSQATDVALDIAYDGTPEFGTDSINGMANEWVELGLDSYWLPVVSDYSHRITGDVKLVLPPHWKMASSGEVSAMGDTLELSQSVPLIDVAFVTSPMLAYTQRGKTRLYYNGKAPAVLPSVMAIATKCTAMLNKDFGATDSLPPIRMVFAPRGGPGYARKNFIVITSAADTSTVQLERFICHELAHYWSSNAIASGPENWLNEAFAEYVAGRYVRDLEGDVLYHTVILKKWQDNASNAGAIWSDSATRRPTARASYNKAPALLDALEQRIGRPAMNVFLARYMRERVTTTPNLLKILASIAGDSTATWFKEQLGSR